MEKAVAIRDPDGRERSWSESVRLYELDELRALFEAAGLRVDGVHGDFAGGAWAPDAARCILVGQRA